MFIYTGQVFGLKLILFGTNVDPLAKNTHVDRNRKQVEGVNINLRKKG